MNERCAKFLSSALLCVVGVLSSMTVLSQPVVVELFTSQGCS